MNTTVLNFLEQMQRLGSSIMLSWAEDDNLWECSWITGGKRFTEHSTNPSQAVSNCWWRGTVGFAEPANKDRAELKPLEINGLEVCPCCGDPKRFWEYCSLCRPASEDEGEIK